MATKYGGYMGKVLMIDLSTGHTSEYPWSDEERRLYIGGKTMAAKILADNLTSDTEPLSEETCWPSPRVLSQAQVRQAPAASTFPHCRLRQAY